MDEFSWFIGIYEGEGCLEHYYFNNKQRIRMAIEMTDEDTIQKVSKYLNVNYMKKKKRGLRKQTWVVRKHVGKYKGKGRELLLKMYPYLSERRKEKIKFLLDVPVFEVAQ